MLDEYDFSKAKKNPYVNKLKKQITINISSTAIDYFKSLADETGIPYQNLINFYLQDCADKKKKLQIEFV